MKVMFLSFFLILISNTVFAKDYICQGGLEEPVIEIIKKDNHTKFRYLVDGNVRLSLNMSKEIIKPTTQFPIGFDAGQTFIFRPGYGETMVHIYGRILPRGAIFDIFVLGMLGNVQRTHIDYKCKVK